MACRRARPSPPCWSSAAIRWPAGASPPSRHRTGWPHSPHPPDSTTNARWLGWVFKLARPSGDFSAASPPPSTRFGVLETALSSPPPIVMISVITIAWQCSGRRVALFPPQPWPGSPSSASGRKAWRRACWEPPPSSAWRSACRLASGPARNRRVLNLMRPVLDLMQTMPAFVYLIPVIAFFGIGKPPSSPPSSSACRR